MPDEARQSPPRMPYLHRAVPNFPRPGQQRPLSVHLPRRARFAPNRDPTRKMKHAPRSDCDRASWRVIRPVRPAVRAPPVRRGENAGISGPFADPRARSIGLILRSPPRAPSQSRQWPVPSWRRVPDHEFRRIQLAAGALRVCPLRPCHESGIRPRQKPSPVRVIFAKARTSGVAFRATPGSCLEESCAARIPGRAVPSGVER